MSETMTLGEIERRGITLTLAELRQIAEAAMEAQTAVDALAWEDDEAPAVLRAEEVANRAVEKLGWALLPARALALIRGAQEAEARVRQLEVALEIAAQALHAAGGKARTAKAAAAAFAAESEARAVVRDSPAF